MSHMDQRLLTTLRDIRAGKLSFGGHTKNDPEVITRLTGLCKELGLDPAIGMLQSECGDTVVLLLPQQLKTNSWGKSPSALGDLDRVHVISCELVHQGVAKSCEVLCLLVFSD